MKRLNVRAGKGYDILIGGNLLEKSGQHIRNINSGTKAAVISDSNVAPLYAETVINSLKSQGFETTLFTFPAGEESKNLNTISPIWSHLAENNVKREDIIVALGGGVVGDMAGFAAATYLRGIDFVGIPTSLLAQIDSSVGGKTGIDLPYGKNLVGSFWQPRLVICDIATLSTLPEKFFADSMAEAIKYGCIKDINLFKRIKNQHAKDFLPDLIFSCLEIKAKIVEADEREAGERVLLNFGHTLGHALELYYNYSKLSHGEAVGIGMVYASLAGEMAGLTKPGTAEEIKKCLEKYGLPTTDPAPLEKIIPLCLTDKKRTQGAIKLVLLKEIGSSFAHKVDIDKLSEFFGVRV